MGEVMLKPTILPESPETITLVDDQTVVFRPQYGRGWTQRQSYADPRWQIKRTYKAMRLAYVGQLIATLQESRGTYNTVWASPAYANRGSFPDPELLSNNDFSNGTTGWTATRGTLTTQDSVLRLTSDGSQNANGPQISATATGVLYAPYNARAMWSATPSFAHMLSYVSYVSGSITSSYTATPGLCDATAVVQNTALTFIAYDLETGVNVNAGCWGEVSYTSLARCMLVDNSPNLLLYSDQFDNVAGWGPTRATVTANTTTAPDGTATGDQLTEDATATTTHLIASVNATCSASTALEYTYSVCLKAGTRTWAMIALREATGLTFLQTYVNLSTGALGTLANGGNWSGGRATVTALGNSWYRVTITGRKTSVATTMLAAVYMATADNTTTYSGDGASYIYMWRAGLAQTGVPFLPGQTTSAATTGTAQIGGELNVRGLPVSTNGLLLAGDFFEVNRELKQCTSALNSDAGGLGTLLFRPALHTAPSDGIAVITNNPMGRFVISGGVSIDNTYGSYADVTVTLDEVFS